MKSIKLIIGMCLAIVEDRVIRFTHRIWNRQVSRIICRAYNDRVINSEQLHTLLAAFDPTQRHMVYGKYSEWTFKMMKEKNNECICRILGGRNTVCVSGWLGSDSGAKAMISADTVLMLVRAIHDGESHARWIDKPLTCVGQNCTFAVVGGLFDGWRLTWHHAKPYGFVVMVQTPLNDIGGFDDWHEDECENPVDDLLESEYRRFVTILCKARKFTGF